ncbi:MAG: META domain-containing protein [Halieaceae bacterium]|nr:META domain-containing protein [Halieaceae bacterium]
MANSLKTATRVSSSRFVLVAISLAVPLLAGCGAQTSEQGADPRSNPVNRAATATEEAQMIHGSWRVTAVNGSPLKKSTGSVTLNIDAKKQRVSGHDGCNNFMGAIAIGEKHQLSFTDVAATKKGCPPGTTPDGFYSALASIARFQYQTPELELMDAEGSVILTAKRDAKG